MKEVIDSYRQQLSDAIHQLTLKDLHIKTLNKKILDMQIELDGYKIAEHNKKHPPSKEPDDWSPAEF